MTFVKQNIESIRGHVLDEAKRCVCTDRNEQYGGPEDSFAAIAELWTQYLRRVKQSTAVINAYDVGVMMAMLKIGRIETAQQQKLDNFVDAAGYIACAAEISLRSVTDNGE